MPISNETRAERAAAALQTYVAVARCEDGWPGIIDLITDLVHLAAKIGPETEGDPLDPLSVLATAQMHFEAETDSPEGSEAYGP